jgi:hypothetical protein
LHPFDVLWIFIVFREDNGPSKPFGTLDLFCTNVPKDRSFAFICAKLWRFCFITWRTNHMEVSILVSPLLLFVPLLTLQGLMWILSDNKLVCIKSILNPKP